jgi:hypothetical protein
VKYGRFGEDFDFKVIGRLEEVGRDEILTAAPRSQQGGNTPQHNHTARLFRHKPKIGFMPPWMKTAAWATL